MDLSGLTYDISSPFKMAAFLELQWLIKQLSGFKSSYVDNQLKETCTDHRSALDVVERFMDD